VGVTADGSGLSRQDRRSAGEWQRLLQAARRAPWFEALLAGLPIAGRTGTLADRFEGTPAVGVVRAKTGSIIEGRALSGYLETASGRAVTFSVVSNGGCPPCTEAAIDALIVAVAADRS
jgi:D-alanyl-D-alanine carboxypeptidase/D-alanyl-D-alanine-endopeptidase (penicillin-binding protein 4)